MQVSYQDQSQAVEGAPELQMHCSVRNSDVRRSRSLTCSWERTTRACPIDSSSSRVFRDRRRRAGTPGRCFVDPKLDCWTMAVSRDADCVDWLYNSSALFAMVVIKLISL